MAAIKKKSKSAPEKKAKASPPKAVVKKATASKPSAKPTKSQGKPKLTAKPAQILSASKNEKKTEKVEPKDSRSKSTLMASAAVAEPASTKKKPVYKPTEADFERPEFNEEDELDETLDLETEAEEVLDEGVEGPPSWWKDDPAAIEGAEGEDESRAEFDDSDEWTEDDESWNSARRESFEEIEEAGEDEDERW